jgi:hypothetical protein
MKNLNKIAKTFAFLSCLSGILWVGSYLLRLLISYQLFQERDFLLKEYYNKQNIDAVLKTLLPAFSTTFILYIVFILSFIVFLISSKINFKENGWLFITAALVFITFPFEVYLMVIDYKIILLLNSGIFESNQVLSLITDRFKLLSSFPIIHVLCYFAIIFIIIFQPLKLKSSDKNK